MGELTGLLDGYAELTYRVPCERTTLPMEMPGTTFHSRWPSLELTDGEKTVLLVSRKLAVRVFECSQLTDRDNHQRMCLTLGLWNGKDRMLKERMFGLNGGEGEYLTIPRLSARHD